MVKHGIHICQVTARLEAVSTVAVFTPVVAMNPSRGIDLANLFDFSRHGRTNNRFRNRSAMDHFFNWNWKRGPAAGRLGEQV
jgi:hypothetical protein